MFAQILANLLSTQLGFQIAGLASSQAQASMLLNNHHPDLVILNLNLGDGSGLALLEGLRHQHSASDDG